MTNEAQKDEIIALESIYTAEEFSYQEVDGQFQCTFQIFPSLPEEYWVVYKGTRNEGAVEEKISIAHLPPLTLFVPLPGDYPSQSISKFILRCCWLCVKDISKLCKKLDEICSENKGAEILFTWVAFLQNETLEYLGIERSLNIDDAYTFRKRPLEEMPQAETADAASGNDTNRTCKPMMMKNKISQKRQDRRHRWKKRLIDQRAIVDRPTNRNVMHYLLEYNEKRLNIEFKKNFYSCKICFVDKPGESCMQFKPCLHVFCKECISGYLEVRIKDGAVQNICCPEEKCTSEIYPGQIKELVSSELFAKYDSTLLSATLDTMLDIIYCPRRDCQYPVSKEANEKMASCPCCQYTFCVYCRMVYHGVEPCKYTLAEKQKLVNEYENASDSQKEMLESRYGKKQLQILVENSRSENWITKNSHNCPHCNAAIEKSDGCNKMTCGRCNTYFCWLCGSRLNHDTPYSHYQDPRSKCYRMLHHGLFGDDDSDDDIELDAVYIDYDSDDDNFVETNREHIIYYVLSQIIYPEIDTPKKEELESLYDFADRCDHIFLRWLKGHPVGFYTVKTKGTEIFNIDSRYSMNTVDTAYIRSQHRNQGLGMEILYDAVKRYENQDIGFSKPISHGMLQVIRRFLMKHKDYRLHFWEVENGGIEGSVKLLWFTLRKQIQN
ncbi:E3 ubiquitin-protein ligase RNF14-like isoform X2 [Diachasmimorpha longicaudata]